MFGEDYKLYISSQCSSPLFSNTVMYISRPYGTTLYGLVDKLSTISKEDAVYIFRVLFYTLDRCCKFLRKGSTCLSTN